MDTNITIAAEIVAAYVSNNSIAVTDLVGLIRQVHGALEKLANPAAPVVQEVLQPAISVKKSVTPDFIICLEDGRKFKSLKRHLAAFDLTPDQYRAKWNLPADYPMVAPNYAAQRSALAKQSGLGSQRKRTPAAKAGAAVAKKV